ncbi:MAG TPA: hypothetical protein VFY50_02040 [Candidatus Nitrosocosmicus sp.]|nr:hypothetical protein [Candidatus Nitrosocosmicus sp.]
MNTKISIILLFISLALLVTYGADVIYSQTTSGDAKSGFLQIDPAVRGIVFGAVPVILSIIAFAISLRKRSTLVVVLLLINGGLIIAGMIGLAAQGGGDNTSTLYGTTGLGILLIVLGIVKGYISKSKKENKQDRPWWKFKSDEDSVGAKR